MSFYLEVAKNHRFFRRFEKILRFSTLSIRKLLYICRLKTTKGETIMARPIAPTPELRGKDAERFAKNLKNPPKVTDAEREAARQAYEAFKAIATFPM